MPFASVIKVTHRDHHKGASDGVEVVYDGTLNKYMAGDRERPARRAWNHPCVIVRRENDDVWLLAMTTFKGRMLEEKLAKYPVETQRYIAKGVVPLFPALTHPLVKEGDRRYRVLTMQDKEIGKLKDIGGYVKLRTVYRMDWRDLQTFNGRNRCLDEESTARLVGLVRSVCELDWAKDGAKVAGVQKVAGKKEIVKKKVVEKEATTTKIKKKATPGPKAGKHINKVMKSTSKGQPVKKVKQKLEIASVRLRKS